jgi:hypothetical protein
LSEAGARAAAITNEAESARLRYVGSITADATNFSKFLPLYETNQSLFVQQQVVAMMSQALTNVQRTELLPTHADGKPIEVRLMLNDEPPQPKPAANP